MKNKFLKTLQTTWHNNDLVTRANALAFGLLISFIPMILLIILSFSSLLPHLQHYFTFSDKDFIALLQLQLSSILPIPKNDLAQTLSFLKANWGHWSHKNILSLSFLLSILYASQAMWLILKSFEMQQLSEYRDTRPYIFRRILSLYFTVFILLIGVGIITTLLGLNILLPKAVTLLGFTAQKLVLLKYLKWFSIILILYFSMCVIYKFGNIEKIRFFSWGAIIATVSIVSISFALSPCRQSSYWPFGFKLAPLLSLLAKT